MSNRSFPEQIHDLWRTRPERLPTQGHIAGICAGIGFRYGVDPVLIRIAFVVSTVFGGAGILLYLAGWLVLTKSGDPVSPAESLIGRGRSSDSGTKTVVLLVALAVAASTVGPFGIELGGSGLISMMLMIGGLWLLHQRQPVAPAPGSLAGAGATSAGIPYPPREPAPGEPVSFEPVPPAWDPLGVAPFAWDLPEPAQSAPSTPARGRHHSRLTTTVIGLAILAAAGATALSVVTGSDWLTPGRIGAIALAVIGVGMLVGSFLRRGYGLLVVTGPLLGFVVLASLVGPVNFTSENFGDRTWTPLTAEEIPSEYTGEFGRLTLDLTHITLTEDKTIGISGQFGEVEVIVPRSMNVVNHCSTQFGDTQCLTDGTEGTAGPVLTLDVNSRFGNVEVRRG